MRISKRHLLKTLTWRIIATTDTIILSWIISGSFSLGLKIGGVELISKTLLYYLHERIWFKSAVKNSNKRHILKTISWRIIGSLDTVILSWIITGNPLTGFKIGIAEVLTKMFLYFGHEKLWYRINFGLDQRIRKKRLQQIMKDRIR